MNQSDFVQSQEIPSELTESIWIYLKVHRQNCLANPTNLEGALFLNCRGKSLSRQAVWKLLQLACRRAGIQKNVSPHQLRHTFATHWLESGLRLRSLQLLLGHQSLKSTQIYTAMSPMHLKAIHKKHHPRG